MGGMMRFGEESQSTEVDPSASPVSVSLPIRNLSMDEPKREFHHRRHVILCVDDDQRLRTDLVEELTAADYEVIEAGNGSEALAALQQRKPHLILCDITMPVMGGYDLLRFVRERRPDLNDVPFIFLSVLGDRKEVIQGKNVGADDYLTKPVDFGHLIATVKARLAQIERMRRSLLSELESERSSLLEKAVDGTRNAVESMAQVLDGMSSGFLVLDANAQVQFMNRTARQIIDEKDGLIIAAGQLRTSAQRATRALKQAVQDILDHTIKSAAVTVSKEFGRPLLLQIFPLSGGDASKTSVAVFVLDPERRPPLDQKVVAEMYGLTKAEARLATAIAEGKRLEEIADAFSVSQTTISFHLQNLFRKTQTSRQTDLVALLIRSALTLQLDDEQ